MIKYSQIYGSKYKIFILWPKWISLMNFSEMPDGNQILNCLYDIEEITKLALS